MKKIYSCLVLGCSIMSMAEAIQANTLQKQLVLKAADGKELIGNILDKNTPKNNGIYKFAIANVSPKPIVTGSKVLANAGSVYYDGHFKYVYADYTYAAQGQTSANLFDYIVGENDTWTSTGKHKSVNIDMVATETAFDRKTGKVYGVFYKDQNLKDTEFGIADYNTLERKTIGPANNKYVAIGLTSDLVMYGIATDGNLYKIDTNSGSETLVGATGLTLLDENGNTFAQSGEIDQRDNTFYWAATDAEGKSGLYTVDLTTGAATLQNFFPNNEQIYALTVPYPVAEDNAPSNVTNLKANFEKDNTSGTISFKTPSITFAGDVLEGNVDYYVVSDNDTIAKGTTDAGKKVSVDVTGKANATNTYTVWTSNSYGAGPKKNIDVYVGLDHPAYSLSNVALEADATTGKVSLTWDELVGTHGGYIGDVTYSVMRNGTETVAENIKENSFSETLTTENGMAAYYYKVTAKCGTSTASGKSNSVILGDHVNTPFNTIFATEGEFNIFAVSDANDDGSTWKYNSYSQKSAQYSCSYTNTADDWLMTPPAKIKSGKTYIVKFNVKENNAKYTNKLEIKYGSANNVEAMKNSPFNASIDVTSKEETGYKFYVKSEKDDLLSVGFHVISEKSMGSLHITSFSIEEEGTTAISDIYNTDGNKSTGIYSIDGRLIKESTNINNLAKGLYIINNKKVLVK